MKKVLSTVAAIGLVAGFAATASASYMEFSVTGRYDVDGRMISDGNSTRGGIALTDIAAPADSYTRSYMSHNFRIYPHLKVNDNISMDADVRSHSNAGWSSGTGAWGANKMWMTYLTPIGKWEIGLAPNGSWGSSYLDAGGAGERIIYHPSMIADPWSLTMLVEKMVEGTASAVAMAPPVSDSDTTEYFITLGYKMDMAKFDLAYSYITTGAPGVTGAAAGTVSGSTEAGTILFHAKGGIGPINYETEVLKAGGDATDITSRDAWGSMITASGSVSDQLTIGAIYFFLSGDDANSTDNEAMNAGGGTGPDFSPFYVLTGDNMGLINSDGGGGSNANMAASGIEAFGVFADFGMSPKTSIHVGLATSKANQVNTPLNVAATSAALAPLIDDDYGWEFNLGVSHKLLDNLTYTIHFGYMEVGDYAKMGAAATNPAEVSIITNHLNMKF